MTLEEAKKQIRPVDQEAVCAAQKRWDSIAKPLHSLGKMEKIVMQIAGITGSADVRLDKRALVARCADSAGQMYFLLMWAWLLIQRFLLI